MTKFEISLKEMQKRLNADSRLQAICRKVWCDGCIKPHAKLVITLFNSSGYEMKFITLKNFTHFKPDADNHTAFENQLESIIGQLV